MIKEAAAEVRLDSRKMSAAYKADEEEKRRSHCIKHMDIPARNTYTRAAKICKVASRRGETEGETPRVVTPGIKEEATTTK